LSQGQLIYCRNKKIKDELIKKGFNYLYETQIGDNPVWVFVFNKDLFFKVEQKFDKGDLVVSNKALI